MTTLKIIPKHENVICLFDGNCRLGDRGAGAAILYDQDGNELAKRATYFAGKYATNNIAEYMGLVNALELAIQSGATYVKILGDSELIIRQFNRKYVCRKAHLKPWLNHTHDLAKKINKLTVEELPRSGKNRKRRNLNEAADALASECMLVGHDLGG